MAGMGNGCELWGAVAVRAFIVASVGRSKSGLKESPGQKAWTWIGAGAGAWVGLIGLP